MFSKRYAHWMYDWETQLTTRDENRVVRPLEWGFEWLEDSLKSACLSAPNTMDNAASLQTMNQLNQWIIQNSEEFYSYQRPTDFRIEEHYPQLFPTNVRPETLAQDAALKQRAAAGKLRKAEFLRFTSPERTPYPENNLVNARWFPAVHKDLKRPRQAIIVLPQWNADALSHNAFGQIFNRMEISVLRLSMPYHDIRRPTELERSDYAVSANIGRTLSACRQAVMEIRCCVDWLEEQGYQHIGVLGTSLGSCYAFLASAHDERIQVNAFNHTSTGFGDVVWTGQSTRHIRQALDQSGIAQSDLRHVWACVSPVSYFNQFAQMGGSARSSSRHGKMVRAKKSLLVYGQYDLTFPLEYSLEVTRAFAAHGIQFERRVLPCGHYTTGETPFKYMDAWYLSSFVYRAFKHLRKTAEPTRLSQR